MKILAIFLLTALIIVCSSCTNPHKEESTQEIDLKEALINENRKFVASEIYQIENYIQRSGYSMDSSGTGLRYQIFRADSIRALPTDLDVVEVLYDIQILSGELVYSKDSLGVRSFVIGKAGIISGIEEGVKKMSVGDRAIFIVPSHLAFGFTGDGNKIPSNATLIVNLELINIITQQ